ncbi:glycine-tRNA ligase [Anncaliia algerae PRA339]|uniref:glycine--tRNA ligase n=1 Tax=Anncaliia algerae PRA339 TaxID=1288291 RepID=A0A059EYK8_9MICR|nr:glycine-tRNA ligase [Anncaliia algerae PRA339]
MENKHELKNVETILKHHLFIIPSFNIYGGSAGIFDFGPLGCKLKRNFVNLWHNYFVEHDDLEELDTSILLSYDVLKASGHVDRFCDYMTFDSVNGEFYRADHLIKERLTEINKKSFNNKVKEIIDSVDKLSIEELNSVIKAYDLKSDNNNALTDVHRFNLIFQTNIGPKKSNVSFLRPETAQGQFCSFFKLNNKLPFGTASIGKVFRNEISPRNFLRLREFEQCEIEYFTDPLDKTFKKVYDYLEIDLPIFKNNTLKIIKVKNVLKECSELVTYFMVRSYLFLLSIGIRKEYIRIRQHDKEEMSHYAVDCWDLEILSSLGYVECIGIADRGVYDLSQHVLRSKVNLKTKRECDKEVYKLFDKEYVTKESVINKLKEENYLILEESDEIIKAKLNDIDSSKSKEKPSVVNVRKERVKLESFTPNVIEPSFGLNRILYCLAEHSYYIREDGRQVFSFNEKMSPYFLEISCIIKSDKLLEFMNNIKIKVSHKKNTRSVSIGKKYSVADEIGIKFYLTIDFQSLEDNKVTIRERDSMDQVRISVKELNLVLSRLMDGEWELVLKEYGKFN